MQKYKKIKRIFLYDEDTPTAYNYEGAYKHIKAISDDETHYFEFIIDQDNYGESLKELCNKFEKFCVDVCGFYDCRYCEVWSTYISHKIVHIDGYRGKLYEDTLVSLLESCGWATVRYIESTYYYSLSHLKNRKNLKPKIQTSFDEFIKSSGYDIQEEPYATKKIFSILKQIYKIK